MLDEPLGDDKGPKIKGSVMLATAESREEVLEELKRDVYFKEGVWDRDRVEIMPVSLSVLFGGKLGMGGGRNEQRFLW